MEQVKAHPWFTQYINYFDICIICREVVPIEDATPPPMFDESKELNIDAPATINAFDLINFVNGDAISHMFNIEEKKIKTFTHFII